MEVKGKPLTVGSNGAEGALTVATPRHDYYFVFLLARAGLGGLRVIISDQRCCAEIWLPPKEIARFSKPSILFALLVCRPSRLMIFIVSRLAKRKR